MSNVLDQHNEKTKQNKTKIRYEKKTIKLRQVWALLFSYPWNFFKIEKWKQIRTSLLHCNNFVKKYKALKLFNAKRFHAVFAWKVKSIMSCCLFFIHTFIGAVTMRL